MSSAIISAVLLAVSMPIFSLPLRTSNGEHAQYTRLFTDGIKTIAIAHFYGSIEVKT